MKPMEPLPTATTAAATTGAASLHSSANKTSNVESGYGADAERDFSEEEEELQDLIHTSTNEAIPLDRRLANAVNRAAKNIQSLMSLGERRRKRKHHVEDDPTKSTTTTSSGSSNGSASSSSYTCPLDSFAIMEQGEAVSGRHLYDSNCISYHSDHKNSINARDDQHKKASAATVNSRELACCRSHGQHPRRYRIHHDGNSNQDQQYQYSISATNAGNRHDDGGYGMLHDTARHNGVQLKRSSSIAKLTTTPKTKKRPKVSFHFVSHVVNSSSTIHESYENKYKNASVAMPVDHLTFKWQEASIDSPTVTRFGQQQPLLCPDKNDTHSAAPATIITSSTAATTRGCDFVLHPCGAFSIEMALSISTYPRLLLESTSPHNVVHHNGAYELFLQRNTQYMKMSHINATSTSKTAVPTEPEAASCSCTNNYEEEKPVPSFVSRPSSSETYSSSSTSSLNCSSSWLNDQVYETLHVAAQDLFCCLALNPQHLSSAAVVVQVHPVWATATTEEAAQDTVKSAGHAVITHYLLELLTPASSTAASITSSSSASFAYNNADATYNNGSTIHRAVPFRTIG